MAEVAALPTEDSAAANPAKVLFGRYILGRLLGQGTFAKVYFAKNTLTASDVAIKIISKDHILREGGGPMVEQRIMREISVMRLVRHPHVVNLREVMATKTRIFFVLEYVKGGELFEKVAKGRLEEGVVRRYFGQLISAVDFCHSRGVSHRDLKPENLLLDGDGDLKVSDFGISALPEQRRQDGLLHTQCGTPNYVAPEVLRNRGYDGAKADLWSCGVILYVLLAGFLPFKDQNIMRVYKKIFKAEFKIPPWFSPGAHHLVSRLLVPEPEKRINVSEIMDDPWLNTDFYVHPKSITSPTSVLPPQLPIETGKNGRTGPPFYNAFELISTLSSGFNLSGMFESGRKADTVFTSRCGGDELMERLEKVGEELGFEVSRVEEYKVKMDRKRGGRIQGLIVMAEVFEVAPKVEVVEFCRVEGDIVEYERFWDEGIRPKMKDVVWTWHIK